MLQLTQTVRTTTARFGAALALAAVAGIAACSSGEPLAPSAPTPASQDAGASLRRSAFIIDVNVPQKRVTITNPATGVSRSFGPGQQGPALSLLGEDAISLTATNFFASAPGALQPNRTEVFFDLAVTNLLPGISLTTPTLPTPPASQIGLILFPFSTTITTSSGGAGGTGGSDVVVELPSRGGVLPSRDWNGNAGLDRATFPVAPGVGGSPHNFFNDTTCPAETSPEVASDCFRYETYGNVVGGTTAASRRVGFSIDAGVSQFRVRIIAAADLLVGAVGTGTINATLTSPQRGPLAGIPIAVSGVATPLTTSALGAVSFTAVPTGVREVWLGAVGQADLRTILPSGCTRLTPVNGQVVNLTNLATGTVAYSVECAPLLGTVSATITRTGLGTQQIDGSTYVITPTAAGLSTVSGQLAGLGFSAATPIGFGTGVGAGAVSIINLPAGCTAAPAAYTGLTTTTAATVALTVDCTPAAAATQYQFRSQFGAVTGGNVDLLLTFDPSGFDSPLYVGADAFSGSQGTITLVGAAASRITSRSAVATSSFGVANVGGTLPVTAWSSVSTQPGGWTTVQTIAAIRYGIGGGASGLVTTSTAITEINDPIGGNFPISFGPTGTTVIIESSVVLP